MLTDNHNKLLIIGRIPPPIGGVTIHTSRLLKFCNKENLEYVFYNLQQFNIYAFLMSIKNSKVAHLHASDPSLLLFFVLSCRLLKTKSIITIHGNLGRYNYLLSFFEKLAIRLCNTPIVLNDNCLRIAIKLNQKTKLMSAFIPPIKEENLKPLQNDQIDFVKRNTKLLFCTNAYDFVFDRFGNEIYGIMPLIDFFNLNPSIGLILSDPKGSYLSYFKKINFLLSKNIMILTGEHSFFEVLKLSDCFIRNTTTDGDSISIREALYLGIHVIATNCVDRPEGVEIIALGDILSLENAINKIIENQSFSKPIQIPNNGGIDLVNLYKKKLLELEDY